MKTKYTLWLLCFFTLNCFKVDGQDVNVYQVPPVSSITLGLEMPASIDGLTDASIARLGEKMTEILTNNGVASDDPNQAFIITPKFDILGVQESSGTMKKIVTANCTLTLFVKQPGTNIIYASSVPKQIQGGGFTKEAAVAQAVNQIRPENGAFTAFIEKAKVKIVAYYQQQCQQFIAKAGREIAQGHYDDARNILLPIPLETGDCYETAQQKIAEIFTKQYGSLDNATDYLQKQLTINPGSGIFSKLLGRVKSLIEKRNDHDNTPPEIDIISPKVTRGQTVEADVDENATIEVSGTAKDPSGVASVMVNGTPARYLSDDGFFKANISKDATTIIIQATDKKGNTGSATFQITVKNEPQASVSNDVIQPISDNERFYAIFIANTDYSGDKWPHLNTPVVEARSIIKVLEDKYNFDPANVDSLFNKSRIEILKAVSEKLKSLGENDNLVLYYGGHGYFVQATNMAYWVPINADNEFDYISNTDISNLLSGCNAKHILVMADACFSGAMRGGLETVSKYEYKFKSRQLLTSGSIEPVPGKSSYVPMVLSVFNSNNQKYLSARDLYLAIAPGIRNQANTDPVLRDLKVPGSEGGEFYFRKK